MSVPSRVGVAVIRMPLRQGFGGTDDELALLHAPGADQGIGDLLHLVVPAPHYQNLQAAVLVDVNVKGRDDPVVVLVLQIKHLLYDRRFTIEGARQQLRSRSHAVQEPMPVAALPDMAEIKQELIRIRDLIDKR